MTTIQGRICANQVELVRIKSVDKQTANTIRNIWHTEKSLIHARRMICKIIGGELLFEAAQAVTPREKVYFYNLPKGAITAIFAGNILKVGTLNDLEKGFL